MTTPSNEIQEETLDEMGNRIMEGLYRDQETPSRAQVLRSRRGLQFALMPLALGMGLVTCAEVVDVYARVVDAVAHPKRPDCDRKIDRHFLFGPLTRLEGRLDLDSKDVFDEASKQVEAGILPPIYMTYLLGLEIDWDNENLSDVNLLIRENRRLRNEALNLYNLEEINSEQYLGYLSELDLILSSQLPNNNSDINGIKNELTKISFKFFEDNSEFYIKQLNDDGWLDSEIYEELMKRTQDPEGLHHAIINTRAVAYTHYPEKCWTYEHARAEVNSKAREGIGVYDKKKLNRDEEPVE